MIITESELEEAIHYISGSDDHYAMCKARFLYETQNLKTQRSLAFLDAPASTVADRTAYSETAESYRAATASYRDAAYDYERCKNKRLSCQLKIDIWRSLESTKRSLIV